MNLQLSDALQILSRTPTVLNTLLRDLPDAWTMSNEGGDSWSPYTVLGHFLHGEETDWIPRARIILEYGESRPFDPFDRFAQYENYNGWTVAQLLDAFTEKRAQNLKTLWQMNIAPEMMELRGVHPALGTVTLGQLIATWVAHDLNLLGFFGNRRGGPQILGCEWGVHPTHTPKSG
ncbi:MAG TPA: DinB family protein, partial [Anaerolineales bacterium]|nr:DinB family protein [Anaerolineales bacterium]